MSILIPAVAGVLLVLLCLPRRRRKDPRPAAPGPERPATVTAAAVQPRGEMTQPFAYDNGLIVEET